MRRGQAQFEDADYQRLLQFRTALRRFLNWSRAQANKEGITPTQHLLLLAVRGHPAGVDPTVGELAQQLQVRHHTMVELIDRAEAAGLVRRVPDERDQRRVRIALTPRGAGVLERITLANLVEYEHLAPAMTQLWDDLEELFP